MKRGPVLVILAATLVAVVSLLTLHLYRQGTREVLSRFQEQQSLLATHLAAQIESFFEARSQSLSALSSLVSSEKEPRAIKTAIDYHARRIDPIYVKAIALYDDRGRILYRVDQGMTAPADAGPALLEWARRKEIREGLLLKTANDAASPLVLLLSRPVYRQRPGSTPADDELAGVLTYVIDVEEFLKKQLGSKRPRMGLDQIWLVDKEGTLHFQPDRPDMVLRNVARKEQGCTSCHPSFSYLQEMLTKKEGVTEYQVRGEPRKIAGFAPISFGGLSWIVVVTAPADRLTAFVWRSLRDHLILLAVILATLITGSYLVVRQERTKTRAEEESLRWREKNAERKAAQEALEIERNKLKGILNAMDDGVYIVGEKYDMIYVNPVIEREYGEVGGRKCHEYLQGRPVPCEECMAAEVSGGKTVHWEWTSRRTGKDLDLLETAYAGPDGVPCKLTIARDITERKRAETALLESEGQLRQLSQQLITARETERKRISRELHDELGQALMVMKLHVNYIRNRLEPEQADLRTECEDAVDYIDQVIENVRRLSRDLSPTILEDFGLTTAIRWLADNFSKRYGIAVSLDLVDLDSFIPAGSHTVAYRIVQEALTNIAKHARAHNISIAVTEEENAVCISITDDGTGFDIDDAMTAGPGERGLGLATMKAHAGMLGGTLSIRPEAGKGCRITLAIPGRLGKEAT